MSHFDDLLAAERPAVRHSPDPLWSAVLTTLILVSAMLSI